MISEFNNDLVKTLCEQTSIESLDKRIKDNYKKNAFHIDNMKLITSMKLGNEEQTEILDYSIVKTKDYKKNMDERLRYRTQRNEKHKLLMEIDPGYRESFNTNDRSKK